MTGLEIPENRVKLIKDGYSSKQIEAMYISQRGMCIAGVGANIVMMNSVARR